MAIIKTDNVRYIKIAIPNFNIAKCVQYFVPKDTIFDVKKKFIQGINEKLDDELNYGLYLPPGHGYIGGFINEQILIDDCNFSEEMPYLELRYKRRVYRDPKTNPKMLKESNSPAKQKRFLVYVRKGAVDKVQKMCEKGLDPNFHDPLTGETPLCIATKILDPSDLLETLVRNGAHIDFRNRSSIDNNNSVIGSTDRNLKSEQGFTPLHVASQLGKAISIKKLLELGSSTAVLDSANLTPFYHFVLGSGLVSDSSEISNSILNTASENPSVIGVDMKVSGAKLLNGGHLVNGGDPLCTRLLLYDGNSPIGISDTEKWQEIHQVCRFGHFKILDMMIRRNVKRNAEVDLSDNNNNNDSVIPICSIDLNAKNASGNTPLHICGIYNQLECANILLKNGADINTLNFGNQTPFDIAILSGNRPLATYMATLAASLNKQSLRGNYHTNNHDEQVANNTNLLNTNPVKFQLSKCLKTTTVPVMDFGNVTLPRNICSTNQHTQLRMLPESIINLRTALYPRSSQNDSMSPENGIHCFDTTTIHDGQNHLDAYKDSLPYDSSFSNGSSSYNCTVMSPTNENSDEFLSQKHRKNSHPNMTMDEKRSERLNKLVEDKHCSSLTSGKGSSLNSDDVNTGIFEHFREEDDSIKKLSVTTRYRDICDSSPSDGSFSSNSRDEDIYNFSPPIPLFPRLRRLPPQPLPPNHRGKTEDDAYALRLVNIYENSNFFHLDKTFSKTPTSPKIPMKVEVIAVKNLLNSDAVDQNPRVESNTDTATVGFQNDFSSAKITSCKINPKHPPPPPDVLARCDFTGKVTMNSKSKDEKRIANINTPDIEFFDWNSFKEGLVNRFVVLRKPDQSSFGFVLSGPKFNNTITSKGGGGANIAPGKKQFVYQRNEKARFMHWPHVILSVEKESPAEQAGIKPGDHVIEVNEVKIEFLKHTQISGIIANSTGNLITMTLVTRKFGQIPLAGPVLESSAIEDDSRNINADYAYLQFIDNRFGDSLQRGSQTVKSLNDLTFPSANIGQLSLPARRKNLFQLASGSLTAKKKPGKGGMQHLLDTIYEKRISTTINTTSPVVRRASWIEGKFLPSKRTIKNSKRDIRNVSEYFMNNLINSQSQMGQHLSVPENLHRVASLNPENGLKSPFYSNFREIDEFGGGLNKRSVSVTSLQHHNPETSKYYIGGGTIRPRLSQKLLSRRLPTTTDDFWGIGGSHKDLYASYDNAKKGREIFSSLGRNFQTKFKKPVYDNGLPKHHHPMFTTHVSSYSKMPERYKKRCKSSYLTFDNLFHENNSAYSLPGLENNNSNVVTTYPFLLPEQFYRPNINANQIKTPSPPSNNITSFSMPNNNNNTIHNYYDNTNVATTNGSYIPQHNYVYIPPPPKFRAPKPKNLIPNNSIPNFLPSNIFETQCSSENNDRTFPQKIALHPIYENIQENQFSPPICKTIIENSIKNYANTSDILRNETNISVNLHPVVTDEERAAIVNSNLETADRNKVLNQAIFLDINENDNNLNEQVLTCSQPNKIYTPPLIDENHHSSVNLDKATASTRTVIADFNDRNQSETCIRASAHEELMNQIRTSIDPEKLSCKLLRPVKEPKVSSEILNRPLESISRCMTNLAPSIIKSNLIPTEPYVDYPTLETPPLNIPLIRTQTDDVSEEVGDLKISFELVQKCHETRLDSDGGHDGSQGSISGSRSSSRNTSKVCKWNQEDPSIVSSLYSVPIKNYETPKETAKNEPRHRLLLKQSVKPIDRRNHEKIELTRTCCKDFNNNNYNNNNNHHHLGYTKNEIDNNRPLSNMGSRISCKNTTFQTIPESGNGHKFCLPITNKTLLIDNFSIKNQSQTNYIPKNVVVAAHDNQSIHNMTSVNRPDVCKRYIFASTKSTTRSMNVYSDPQLNFHCENEWLS